MTDCNHDWKYRQYYDDVFMECKLCDEEMPDVEAYIESLVSIDKLLTENMTMGDTLSIWRIDDGTWAVMLLSSSLPYFGLTVTEAVSAFVESLPKGDPE